MKTAEIKDLCFAMAALARIPGEEAAKLFGRIRDLTADLIYEEERQLHQPHAPKSPTNLEDEIPF